LPATFYLLYIPTYLLPWMPPCIPFCCACPTCLPVSSPCLPACLPCRAQHAHCCTRLTGMPLPRRFCHFLYTLVLWVHRAFSLRCFLRTVVPATTFCLPVAPLLRAHNIRAYHTRVLPGTLLPDALPAMRASPADGYTFRRIARLPSAHRAWFCLAVPRAATRSA